MADSNTSSPKRGKRPDDSNTLPQIVVGLIVLMLLVIVIKITTTVKDESVPYSFPGAAANSNTAEAAAEPDEQPAEQPAETQPVVDPFKVELSIDTIADPQVGWFRIERQSRPAKRSSATAQFKIGNDFTIQTENVERWSLDLSQLPVGLDSRVILHIDGLNMTVFPKGSSLLTFNRTPAGRWFLDKN